MSTTSIRRVSHSEIFAAHNVSQLITEYAAECSVPDARPQAEIYAAMEQAGVLQCFGAYQWLEHPLDDPTLVGFVSVVCVVSPHLGKRVAAIESLFVLSARRKSSAASDLLTAAELYAAEVDCVAIVYTARMYSTLEKVLMRRPGCEPTHTQFTRTL